MSTNGLQLPLPPAVFEAIARRATELALERLGDRGSPWLTRAEAATYLGPPVSRLEKDSRILCHRGSLHVVQGDSESH